jgi:uncharacterized protein with FMN-binding domain
MKKNIGYLVGVIIIIVIAFYVYWQNTNSTPVATTTNNTTPTDTTGEGTPSSSNTSSGNGTGVGATIGVSSTITTGTSGYKDGSYTGAVEDAVYGKLQVAITVSQGKITNVTWPVYPNDGGHSIQISNSALPTLKQEAITAQSANVNIVSGATQTSEAFQQSLASALSQATS